MSSVTRTETRTRIGRVRENARTAAFYAVSVAFLAFLLYALHEPMRAGILAWAPVYEPATHRVHHVMWGSFLTLIAAGVALQLSRPADRVGAYLLAAIAVGVWSVLALVGDGFTAIEATATFVVPMIVLGLLHPGLGSFRPSLESLDTRMLALAVLAAAPLAAFAAVQVNLHLTTSTEHALLGHHLAMAAGASTIALGAIVASFRPDGWRALAYAVALLTALVGFASGLFLEPAQGTTFGLFGGVLALIWTHLFLTAAEYGAWEASNADAAGESSSG